MTTPVDNEALGELYDLVHQICLKHGTPHRIEPVGAGSSRLDRDPPDARLWQQLNEAGVLTVDVPEARGGLAMPLIATTSVLSATAYHAANLPVAESSMLANWLLGLSDIAPLPTVTTAADASELLTLVDTGNSWRLTGRLERVPWGLSASRIVLLAAHRRSPVVIVLDASSVTGTPGSNIANEPRDCLQFDIDVEYGCVTAIEGIGLAELRAEFASRTALSRAVQLAAAARRTTDLTYRYVGEREQFGKPLLQFQTVRQLAVRMTEWSTLMSVAADAAAVAFAHDPDWGQAAAAKCITSDLADSVARTAHQLHGAIGATVEYPVHRFTARLWAWSAEAGNGLYWAEKLGRDVADGSGLWESVTALG